MAKTTQPLRVHQLYAENFKRLKIVDIRPDPDEPIIVLTGKNRQGKTSVIELIWSLLLGEKFIPDTPIGDGAQKAKGFLDLGDFTVTRSFTKAGGTLTVKAKDGFKAPSPQEFLSSRVGNLIHNPLEFMRLKAAQQVEILQGLVNLEVNLEEFGEISGFKITEAPKDPLTLFDSALDNLTERRKTANTEAARLKGVVESTMLPEGWEGIQAVSVVELFEERKRLEDISRAHTEVRSVVAAVEKRKETLLNELEKATKLVAELEEKLSSARESQAGLTSAVIECSATHQDAVLKANALVDPDFTDINARIASADEMNKLAGQIKRHQESLADLNKQREVSADFTRRMDAIKEYKGRLIAQAGMPVAGLGFADGVVTFNDRPLSVASGAEQIHVSCAVCMASHPQIGLLTINVGWSELDKESQNTLREWARKMGVHVVCTKVAEDPEAEGWHIFDGEVVAINGKAPPAVEPVKKDASDSGLALEDAPKEQEMPSFMTEEDPDTNRGPHLPGANVSGSLPKRLAKPKSNKEED